MDTTWNNLMLGLRLGPDPRCGVSTTPKPLTLVKQLVDSNSTVPTSASTYDNMQNLAPTFREKILTTYEGTRIGRQEVMGELLTDVDGALVTIAMLDEYRLLGDPAEGYTRKVVAVDPATTSGEQSDETGIVVCAKGKDLQGYVLGDYSCKLSPALWAKEAVRAYWEHECDAIVVEKNQGGEAWEQIIHSVNPTIRVIGVHARQGKLLRAEPCAAMIEQGRIHMVGSYPRWRTSGRSGCRGRTQARLTVWMPWCMASRSLASSSSDRVRPSWRCGRGTPCGGRCVGGRNSSPSQTP